MFENYKVDKEMIYLKAHCMGKNAVGCIYIYIHTYIIHTPIQTKYRKRHINLTEQAANSKSYHMQQVPTSNGV